MTPTDAFPAWSAADFWTFGGLACGFLLCVAAFIIIGLRFLEHDDD